jgi:23S rRNA (cytidine1920-2'-O)/16S rRNA (cytidine1409-2'-O)-methyltransferase
VSKSHRARFVALTTLLARRRPDVDPTTIASGRVLVDGRLLTNPSARVRVDASIRVLPLRRLRGDVKLSYALDTLPVRVADRVAVDVGASAGGFTTALLDRGARRVYAVDVGVGLLVGRLRNDKRVLNLERQNLGSLSRDVVPDVVELITMDLSYLALADAVPQLERLDLHAAADLVGLVKPTFELHRATVAKAHADVVQAVQLATEGIHRAGWTVVRTCDAPATGERGAREAFVHARRRPH